MTFDSWLREVDVRMEARIGLDHRDMEDWTWRDAYDDGATPSEALDDFFEYAGIDF